MTATRGHIPTNRKIFTGADIFRVSARVFLNLQRPHRRGNGGADFRVIQNVRAKFLFQSPVPLHFRYEYVSALETVMLCEVTQIGKTKTQQQNRTKTIKSSNSET